MSNQALKVGGKLHIKISSVHSSCAPTHLTGGVTSIDIRASLDLATTLHNIHL